MSKVDRIYKTLWHCAAALDQCAELIRDARLNADTNVHRIGMALANIFEIQNEIFRQRPDLKPKEWDKPVSATQRKNNRRFGKLLIQTEDLCQAQNPRKAIEKLRSFIRERPGKRFIIRMAEREVTSIQSKFHRQPKETTQRPRRPAAGFVRSRARRGNPG